MRKHKLFAKGLYLVFALALVVGLAVVPAVMPVSASVSKAVVTNTPETKNVAAQYTIAFTTYIGLVGADDTSGSADKITVIFPAGTTVPDSSINTANVVVNGNAPYTVVGKASERDVIITLKKSVAAGPVEVAFSTSAEIKNPNSVASDWTLTVETSQEDTPVTSKKYSTVAAAAIPVVDSALPKYGVRDSTLDVVITGTKLTGATAVSFGFGITTNTFTVDSATKITANITISATASIADHNVVVTIAGDARTGDGIFTVGAGPANVKMYDASGEYYGATKTIAAAIGYVDPDYTIEVTAGTYALTSTLEINVAGLTLKGANYGVSPVTGTRGAESIIKGSSSMTFIGGAIIHLGTLSSDLTIDGFTIQGDSLGGYMGIYSSKSGITIRNNKFIDINSVNLVLDSAFETITSATFDNNTFIGEGTSADEGIALYGNSATTNTMSGVTISNNTLSNFGGGGTWAAIMVYAYTDPISAITIKGNTVTDCLGFGLGLKSTDDMASIAVTGNTFSGCKKMGIKILGTNLPTKVTITGNDITDNTGVGIKIEKWHKDDVIKFNNITGNTDYGIENTSTVNVNATHNWWGTTVASEIAGMINDTSSGVTAYDPWLGASVSAAKFAALAATSLDAATAVGVKVSGVTAGDTNKIGAALYTENPKTTPTFTVVENSYTDVYVAPTAYLATDEIILRFSPAGVDENSVVYAWNETYGTWQQCTLQKYSPYAGGYVWVKVHSELNTTDPTTPTIEALTELPFVVSGEAVPPDPWDYDVDEDGVISKTEALTAVADYFDGIITKAQALEVIALYFE